MAKANGIDFVRIGTNIDRYREMREIAELAKELGLWVGLNLMKSYAVKSYEFCKIAKEMDSWCLSDAIYFVDSSGCMMPNEVTEYINFTREFVKTPLGFHGHNNLSMAIANTLAAARAGAEYLDSSILGLGRSAGNAQTEILTHVLKKSSLSIQTFDQYALYDFATNIIRPLMKEPQGIDQESIHIGVSKFHTSYLPIIESIAEDYDVSIRELIKEVSDVDCLDPSQSLIKQIALNLK